MSLSPSKGPQKSAQRSKHLVLSSHNAARTHASLPTPSATAATPASKTAVIPQESGRVCPTCRVKVALSSDGACKECTDLKKARVREGKKKESGKKKKALVSNPSAKHNKQKTLLMVSMDASGGSVIAVAKNVGSGSSAAIESIASGHIDKKPKLSSSPATEVPNTATRTSSQTQYQTDKHLYAHLRLTKLHSRSSKYRLNFTGSYSIIKDPKTRNIDLINTVFEAVKDRGCVRFKRDSIGSSADDRPRPRSSFTERLCACQKDCSGRVRVSVVDDDETHPLGFKGQKITVKVKH